MDKPIYTIKKTDWFLQLMAQAKAEGLTTAEYIKKIWDKYMEATK